MFEKELSKSLPDFVSIWFAEAPPVEGVAEVSEVEFEFDMEDDDADDDDEEVVDEEEEVSGDNTTVSRGVGIDS